MKNVRTLIGLSLALTCASSMATVSTPEAVKAASGPQAQTLQRVDNTSINERDRDGTTKTPQDQANGAQDREMLASVRRSLVADESLSTMAKNVKVLVDSGVVTLRGPVKSADEKAKVESLAKNVKGITTADNQLDVKADVAAQ